MTHIEIPPLTWSIVSGALLIFMLRIIDVSILINTIDAQSFITVDDNRQVLRGYRVAK